jgi:hypothetical protein
LKSFCIGSRLAVSHFFGVSDPSTLDCALPARFASLIQDPLALPRAFIFLVTLECETSFCNDLSIHQAMMIRSATTRNEIILWALRKAVFARSTGIFLEVCRIWIIMAFPSSMNVFQSCFHLGSCAKPSMAVVRVSWNSLKCPYRREAFRSIEKVKNQFKT